MGAQLRKYSAYSQTAGLNLFSHGVFLSDMTVNYNGSGSEYFMVFDKATAPAAADVPVASIKLGTGSSDSIAFSFFEEIGSLKLDNGLSVGISSTEASYTASASQFDVWGNVEEWELPQVDTVSTTFPYTSSQEKTVWAEGAGPKALLEIHAYTGGSTTAIRYIMLFAHASAANGERPIEQWKFSDTINPTAATAMVLRFGKSGYKFFEETASGTLKQGCYLILSDTPTVLTKSSTGSGDAMNVYATYK